MPLPRPAPGLREAILLAAVALLAAKPAPGIDIRTGNLIITDRTADPFGFGDNRGSLMLFDEESEVPVHLIASPLGFREPVETIPLSDGRILCLDADAEVMGDTQNRGALWVIDPAVPLPGRADPFAWSPDWVEPVDILQESTGDLLILDADADPLGVGTKPGAIFRVDFLTQQVTAVASSGLWSEPVSMTFDLDGTLLVWDKDADPNNLGTDPGALFRVDPNSGSVELVFSIDGFVAPAVIGVAQNGDFLLLDRDANPLDYPEAPGGIFRITRPPDLVVEPFLFLSDFVEPADFLVDPSGDIWVLDQRANPINFPRPTGAIFRCDPETGEILRTVSSGFFRDLNGVSRFSGSALDSSVVVWEDLSGAPIQPGDRMRVRVRARNTGPVAARPVVMEHQITGAWDYLVGSDSISYGSYSYDAESRIVTWSGDIESQGEALVSYEIRLDDDVSEGSVLRQEIALQVGRTGSAFLLEGVVAHRSVPGRVVWSDYAPSVGTDIGMILEMPEGATVPSVIYEGVPLVQPDDLVLLPDGRIAVLDRRSEPLGPDEPPGGIYRIDPLDGSIDTLLAVAEHPELRFPVGLANGRLGELLLVDKDANPLGHPGLPGAVYAVDIETGSLELIASDESFREPADVIVETTGTILLVDYDADPFGTNPRGGAVFEIDRDAGTVQAIEVPSGTFVDPIGIAEGGRRRIYVADISADPNGIGGNTGAIFEIHRLYGDLVLVASADTLYVDPTDVFATDDGKLIVTDRDANPFDLPPRDRGAVYTVRPRIERPQVVAADPMMYGPEAVAGMVVGDLEPSSLSATDLNGLPTMAGDTLRFEALILNDGRAPVPEALATIQISAGLTLLGGEGPGNVVVDTESGVVSWLGSVSRIDTIRVTADAQVGEDLVFGDRVFGLMHLSGPGAPLPDSAVVSVVAPLLPGDVVLVDSNADPDNLGESDGALFLIRIAEGKVEHVLQTDPLWHDPSAIAPLDPGRFLLADPQGVETGAIFIADYLRGSSEPYLVDERLGSPSDLFWTAGGDLLVTDPFSKVDLTEFRRPVVFIQRGGAGELSVLCADSILSQPLQVAQDDAGRLWMIDRTADPNGAEEGRGALFEIDLETGSLLDTLQFPEFLSPSGILSWPGEGLLIVDEFSQVGGMGGGAVFLFDPEQRSLETRVVDSRFRQPHRAAFTPSGELWITDRLARDESLPGSPRTLFQWDPETDQLEPIAASGLYVSPVELFALPGPNPRLSEYGFEDLNGFPLEAGDEVIFRARVENVGPIETLAAVFEDTLPARMRLDETSVRADAGVIEFTAYGNGLTWRVDLPPGSSYELRYSARLHPGTYQGTNLRFRSHLWTVEGVHRVRRVYARVPVYLEEGYLYLADDDADPFNLGGRPGGLWKVFLSNGAVTAMAGGPELLSPVDALVMPRSEPTVLIVDAAANPNGFPRGRGSLWRWVPETGAVELVAADSLFRSPRAAVAINDHEVLVLDTWADPFELTRGLGPGAIFLVDIDTGEVEPFASDTLMGGPVDLILDGQGGAFVVDPDADPGRFGLRNGAVFRIDLAERVFSVFAASADFRGPVAATLGPDRALYVLDRDAVIYPDTDARGAVYKVDPFGNVSLEVSSQSFRRPHDIAFDPYGRMIVSDREADPRSQGAASGAIFRREHFETQFRVLSAYSRFVDPSGFFLLGAATAIGISGLEATASEEGIQIDWQARDVAFEGFLCERAEGLDAVAEDYRVLNPEEPVPGRGPWVYLDREVSAGVTYSYRIVGLLSGGGARSYGPVVATASALRRFALLPPSPNPVLGRTSLRFDLPAEGRVGVRIYDLTGRRVRTLHDGSLPAGRHVVDWDGRNERGHPVASGLFLIRLTWRDRAAVRRIILLR